MAEKFNPSAAQEFVGENKELPTRDELLSMFTDKQAELKAKLQESEAKPGFKLDANEMMAKKRTESELKSQIETLTSEWDRFGGDKIDQAQAEVDALDFRSDASDHIQAKYALRDAKEAFYSNFTEEFNTSDETSPETEGAQELGELSDDEWAELEAQRTEADAKRKQDHMPRSLEDASAEAWDAYEADDFAEKDSQTDPEVSKAKSLVESGGKDNIEAAQKIYNKLLKKARKSVESGRYNPDDFNQAAKTLFAEIFGKTEAEIDQARKLAEEKNKTVENETTENAEADVDNDADNDPEDIIDRLNKYKERAVEPSEEHQAIFDQTKEALEAENKPGRIKRLLSRFSLHKSGIKRPSLISRFRQGEDYIRYVRERSASKKERLDQKLEQTVSRAEARQERRRAKLEADADVDVDETEDNDNSDTPERSGRDIYQDEREQIEKMVKRAKRRHKDGEVAKSKELYQAARKRLEAIEPLGDNQAFYDTFDDEFYDDINEFGANFEEEAK